MTERVTAEQLEGARMLVDLADTLPSYVGCPGFEERRMAVGYLSLEIANARALLARTSLPEEPSDAH